MSHYVGLVLGPDPEGQLAPYDENLEVEPYIDTCWDCEANSKYQPSCDTCNGAGKIETTTNKAGRWNYWRVGGRWRGFLFLKEGATGELGELSHEWTFNGPCTEDWTGRADVARVGDVDWATTGAYWCEKWKQEEFSAYALVAEGIMRERREWDGEEFIEFPNWSDFFQRMVFNAPPDTLITVVDYHS